MAATAVDIIKWSSSVDVDGHREYKVTFLVITTDTDDDPEIVLNAAGLPLIGDSWAFGNGNDPWARNLPTATVTPVLDNEPNKHWHVELTYSTKPINRCQTAQIDNPLDEPPTVGGTFVKYTKEARYDKDGFPITNSSHELFRGALVEVDHNRPTVSIGKNFATNQLTTFASMVDTVNDATLWGLGPRRIKLSNVSWDRKYYGTCSAYYTANYEFEIKYETFDISVPDSGSMEYKGPAGGNRNNPKFFQHITDGPGNLIKDVPLDGNGNRVNDIVSAYIHTFKIYRESNFLLLGIPTSL